MAEITLADYTGYIFLELIKAREMADAYSRAVATAYAQDEILKHFSTPRFKIPKMELTIPVLIAGAKFSQAVKYSVHRDEFRKLIAARVLEALRTVQAGAPSPLLLDVHTRDLEARAVLADGGWEPSAMVVGQINAFHAELQANADPLRPEQLCRIHWERILSTALQEAGLSERYRKQYPGNQLFESSLAELQLLIKKGTLVSRTRISNLLVNPETNVVKNGSDEVSVFVIRADLTEEGFFVRTVTDPQTGSQNQVVEFE